MQTQNQRYLTREQNGPVASNVEVEYLQPKLAPAAAQDSPIPAEKAARGRGASAAASAASAAAAKEAAKEAAAEAAAAMKVGRISRGGGAGAGGGSEVVSAEVELTQKRNRVLLEEEGEGMSVGGWRIAQVLCT